MVDSVVGEQDVELLTLLNGDDDIVDDVLFCVVVKRDAAVVVVAAAAANKSLACIGKKFVGMGLMVVVLIICKTKSKILFCFNS